MTKILSFLLLIFHLTAHAKTQEPSSCINIDKVIINSLGGYTNLYNYSVELSSRLKGAYEVILNNSSGALADALSSAIYNQNTNIHFLTEFVEGQCEDQVSEIRDAISQTQLNPNLDHRFVEKFSNALTHTKKFNNIVYIKLNQNFALKSQ